MVNNALNGKFTPFTPTSENSVVFAKFNSYTAGLCYTCISILCVSFSFAVPKTAVLEKEKRGDKHSILPPAVKGRLCSLPKPMLYFPYCSNTLIINCQQYT